MCSRGYHITTHTNGCIVCDNILTGRQKKYCSSKCQKLEGRRAWVLKVYGITLEEYDKILHLQMGGCGICGTKPKSGKALAVDHDHQTGKVRGLLCFFCNRRVLGARTAEVLIKTANYVSDPPAPKALGRDVIAPGRPKKKRQPRKRKG